MAFCDFIAGVPQNKAEAERLYREAADGGVAAAAVRLKTLHPHQSSMKYTNKGLCVQLLTKLRPLFPWFTFCFVVSTIIHCTNICYWNQLPSSLISVETFAALKHLFMIHFLADHGYCSPIYLTLFVYA